MFSEIQNFCTRTWHETGPSKRFWYKFSEILKTFLVKIRQVFPQALCRRSCVKNRFGISVFPVEKWRRATGTLFWPKKHTVPVFAKSWQKNGICQKLTQQLTFGPNVNFSQMSTYIKSQRGTSKVNKGSSGLWALVLKMSNKCPSTFLREVVQLTT